MSFTKRGLPDDYDIVRQFLATALHDDAELAIRLGAPVSLNRQGNVIYQNGFGDGFGILYAAPSGSESSAYLSNAAPRSQGVNLFIQAGSSSGNYVSIIGGIRLPDTLSMGLEFAVAVLDSNAQITVMVYVYDGSIRSQYGIQIICSTGETYIYNAASEWEQIQNTPILETGWALYHQIKLVIDNDTREYRRLIIDETQISLVGNIPAQSASGEQKLCQFDIKFETVVDFTKQALLDDVIFTLNEI